jgi:hypothetical protein
MPINLLFLSRPHSLENSMMCKRELVRLYIENDLKEDALLDFLLHLDSCRNCRDAVFLARQEQDARYYKQNKPSSSRRPASGRRRKAS